MHENETLFQKDYYEDEFGVIYSRDNNGDYRIRSSESRYSGLPWNFTRPPRASRPAVAPRFVSPVESFVKIRGVNGVESDLYIDKHFLRRYPEVESVFDAFKSIPNVVLFGKDKEGHYIAANGAMVDWRNQSDVEDLLGETDYTFYPPALASEISQEEYSVVKSGSVLNDKAGFQIDPVGHVQWFSSSKMPIRNRGIVVGMIGVIHHLDSRESRQRHFGNLYPAIRHLVANYTASPSLHHLASLAGLGMEELNRKFYQIFGMAPFQFQQAFRMEKACHLLTRSELSVRLVALETGFHDSAHFRDEFDHWNGIDVESYRKMFV